MPRLEISQLTQVATTLPYDERVALLEALEQSIKNEQEQVDPRIEALNGIFGMLSPDEAKEIRENKVIFRGGL